MVAIQSIGPPPIFRAPKQFRYRDMANPESDKEDLEMGNARTASDGKDTSIEVFGTNEHDILWIDAVGDGTAAGGADAADWTLGSTGHASAQLETDQWIAAEERSTGGDVLLEEGLALTSIDGLPW